MTDESFAEDLAAELQLSLPEKADKLESEIKELRTIAKTLRATSLVRALDTPDEEFRITAVTSSSQRRPALSGMLYGVVASTVSMTLDDKDIVSVDRRTRTDIDLIDFADSNLRIRWKERELMTELLSASLETARSHEIILTDQPLTLTRQEVLTRTDSHVSPAWNELLEQLDAFWRANHREIQPASRDGPVVVGLASNRSDLLFSALRNTSPEEWDGGVGAEVREKLSQSATRADQIGPHRLLERVLRSKERTVHYPYKVSALDQRWLPEELNDLGIQGLSAQISESESVTHFELPGQSNEWDPEVVDDIMNRVSAATFPRRRSVPIPLWQAREECQFPRQLLESYFNKLQEQIETDE